MVGPSVELRLPAGFAFGVDALYQRVGSSSEFVGISGTQTYFFNTRQRGNSWEFPMLGKYYLRRHGAWQPFLGAGVTVRRLSYAGDYAASIGSGLNLGTLAGGTHYENSAVDSAATAAAGIRLRTGRVSWLPQVRYAHWGQNVPLSRPNRVDFLLGVELGGRR